MTVASPSVLGVAKSAEPVAVSRGADARLRQAALDHFSDIWRFLRRLGVPHASVEDATQDVFLVAARKFTNVTPGTEKSFLFGIALRVAHEAQRKFAREQLADDPDDAVLDPASYTTPESSFDRKEEQGLLLHLLSGLPDDLRTTFVLYEIEGMSFSEIAALLGIPMGTVASRLRRAREKFDDRVHKLQSRMRGRNVRGPRRWIEERKLFARLVTEDSRAVPRPEALQHLLNELDAAATRTATHRPARFAWMVLAGAIIAALTQTPSLTSRLPSLDPLASSASASARADLPNAPTDAPATEAIEAVPAVAVGDLPDVPRVAERSALSSPIPSPILPSMSQPSSPKPTLRREVELIVAAGQALSHGNARACLSSLDLYDREFPAGQFTLEGSTMRVEALALAGDRAQATQLARGLLARAPDSPYAARLRSLLGDGDNH